MYTTRSTVVKTRCNRSVRYLYYSTRRPRLRFGNVTNSLCVDKCTCLYRMTHLSPLPDVGWPERCFSAKKREKDYYFPRNKKPRCYHEELSQGGKGCIRMCNFIESVYTSGSLLATIHGVRSDAPFADHTCARYLSSQSLMSTHWRGCASTCPR